MKPSTHRKGAGSAPARAAFALLSLAACGTLGIEPAEDLPLPSAMAGPFRELKTGEIGRSRAAPFALADDTRYSRDPAVLVVAPDPGGLESVLYVAAATFAEGEEGSSAAPTRAILRHGGGLDGRSFERQAETVLEPALDWEGGVLASPHVLRVGAEVWLYYAAAGGIGLARSADGRTFEREPVPVLGPADTGGWEDGAVPQSPAVVRMEDGSFRMFYEARPGLEPGGDPALAAASIGEATSSDGRSFTRVPGGPALAPRPGRDASGEPFYDGASVEAPFARFAQTAEGRPLLRLYYGAVDEAGSRTIALAARFLEGSGDPAFQRAATPVYASQTRAATEPWVVPHEGFSLLFATTRPDDAPAGAPAIIVAVTPADAPLPPATE